MIWTRREFLAAAGVGVGLASAAAETAPFGEAPPPRLLDDPRWLTGDPHLACAPGVGLGGGSFDSLRAHALRFRTPAVERDRHALGVELERA